MILQQIFYTQRRKLEHMDFSILSLWKRRRIHSIFSICKSWINIPVYGNRKKCGRLVLNPSAIINSVSNAPMLHPFFHICPARPITYFHKINLFKLYIDISISGQTSHPPKPAYVILERFLPCNDSCPHQHQDAHRCY